MSAKTPDDKDSKSSSSNETTTRKRLKKIQQELRTPIGKIVAGLVTVAIITAVGFASATSVTSTIDKVKLSRLTAKIEKIYTQSYQKKAQAALVAERDKSSHDQDDIFVKYNPYGTDTTGAYIYFTTDQPAKVSYTISAPDTDYPDFSATPDKGDEYTTTHEFQALGLIPEATNTITINITLKNGEKFTRTINHKQGKLQSEVEIQLKSTKKNASQDLGNGLYAILGNDSDDQDFMYYYDTHGVIRGEIPILFYRSHRLLFRNDLMYFSASTHLIVGMNKLGRLVKFYNTGTNYILHHDYEFDKNGNFIVLATDLREKTIQDKIIKIDAKTGKVSLLVDMVSLFKTYEATAKNASLGSSSDTTTTSDSNSANFNADSTPKKKDWIHLNTIQVLDDGSAIVSSRETSTIIKINSIESKPSIGYMIGEKNFWKGTDYTKYLLTQKGSFPNTGGQHSVTYVSDPSLPDGEYYLYMFDNNYGLSNTRPDYDWAANTPGINTSMTKYTTSDYDKYLVNEKTGTYQLASTFKVPFSPLVSSAQDLSNGTILIDSGMRGTFGVYTSNGKLISQWKMQLRDTIIYRVYQYDFHNFYFA
ncbi:MAG: aryl-sulfate sulfotransferase [Bifidobacterium sp.]|uniref:aryl-sulfate sulfotransferase n=1 Tax=Bifidobacterium sp. TaxID=41200 RepID=UPI0039EB7117